MARYMDAVAWVAYNDDACMRDEENLREISQQVTVALIADLFGKDAQDVARKVLELRWEEDEQREGEQARARAFAKAGRAIARR